MPPSEGFRAIPVFPGTSGSPLAVCAVLAERETGASLVPLRSTFDGDVWLGAVTDGSGSIREWLEIWVQAPRCGDIIAGAESSEINNAALDARWRRWAGCLARVGGSRHIGGAWEREHPAPIWLDAKRGSSYSPGVGEDGGPWVLCTDERALSDAGLPGYAGSRERFLWRGVESEPTFVATPGSSFESGKVARWAGVFPGRAGHIALNPCGGLMLFRRLAPITLESYLDWLTGGRLSRPPASRQGIAIGSMAAATRETEVIGGLHPAAGGAQSRVAEILYLKLRVMISAVEAVRDAVRGLDRPLLSVSGGAFGVEIAEPGAGLPYAWTARVLLEDPGDAAELAGEPGKPRRFVPCRESGVSAYRGWSGAGSVRLIGRVHIRRVGKSSTGEAVFEGTIRTGEILRPGGSVVTVIHLRSAPEALGLRVAVSREGTGGEYGFVSEAVVCTADQAAEWQRLAGVDMGECAIVQAPALSSPGDLHSLAVLCLRTLVATTGEQLGEAVDAAVSLAEGLSEGPGGVAVRARELAGGTPRVAGVLGPHRLVAGSVAPAEVRAAIPEDLWWGIIGTVAKMFPGRRSSFWPEMGVPAGRGLEEPFGEVLVELVELARLARGLLAVDWTLCEELGQILERRLADLSVSW